MTLRQEGDQHFTVHFSPASQILELWKGAGLLLGWRWSRALPITQENDTSAAGPPSEATGDGEPAAREQQHLGKSNLCAALEQETTFQPSTEG